MQEIAVLGSSARGWHPMRYRQVGSAFVVRSMTVVHHRETHYGEPLRARTWVADFRRGILTRREVRIDGIASGSQEWVHVSADMKPTRAPAEMLAAFEPEDHEPAPELPAWEPVDGPAREFAFTAWFAWMDPLGHANHPMVVDWCDEALARWAASADVDPTGLQPVAERVAWTGAVEALQDVVVSSRIVGRAGDAAVFVHEVRRGGAVSATATTIRRIADGGDLLSRIDPG